MLSAIKNLFGNSSQLNEYLHNNALIVDVRTPHEFASGHIQGSINIPLDAMDSVTKKLKPQDHIIVCCRSGTRSAMAMGILKSKGYKNVVNGGGWQSLNLTKQSLEK
ncbi:MAG: sulfurtransferase [Bacteroidota bacterium]|jgi:rhodanese-related sulfurtransferase|nr:sulfurtransferase [Bacteroidota bacterium]